MYRRERDANLNGRCSSRVAVDHRCWSLSDWIVSSSRPMLRDCPRNNWRWRCEREAIVSSSLWSATKETDVHEFDVFWASDLILVEKLHLHSDVRLQFLVFVFGLVEFSLHFILLRTNGKQFEFCSTGIEFQSKGNDLLGDGGTIDVLTERSRRDEWCWSCLRWFYCTACSMWKWNSSRLASTLRRVEPTDSASRRSYWIHPRDERTSVSFPERYHLEEEEQLDRRKTKEKRTNWGPFGFEEDWRNDWRSCERVQEESHVDVWCLSIARRRRRIPTDDHRRSPRSDSPIPHRLFESFCRASRRSSASYICTPIDSIAWTCRSSAPPTTRPSISTSPESKSDDRPERKPCCATKNLMEVLERKTEERERDGWNYSAVRRGESPHRSDWHTRNAVLPAATNWFADRDRYWRIELSQRVDDG